MLETILNVIGGSIAVAGGLVANAIVFDLLRDIKAIDSKTLRAITYLAAYITVALDIGAVCMLLSFFGIIK